MTDEVLQFAGRIARAMKGLSSSHVYFIVQQAYGEIDWSEVEEILQKVIDATPGIHVARQPSR